MPARPFTRAQALQNRRFLDALAQTGNARLAARALGVNRSTFTKRRAKHPAFAQGWAAALAAAHARFHLAGGERPASPPVHGRGDSAKPSGGGHSPPNPLPFTGGATPRSGAGVGSGARTRTKGGEPVITRTRHGKLQLRLAPPGRMTRAAEQAFLTALAATANVRLSAAAAGFAHTSFYHRRAKSRAFAREMRLALEQGYDRLTYALIESSDPASYEDDSWRHNDPLPIPPMTAYEALHLLTLHHNTVRLGWDAPHRRRRRGETDAQYRRRLFLMWRAEQRHVDEERAVARAERYAETGDWRLAGEPEPAPELPPLHLVTGWSKAKPRGEAVHHSGVPLFGGWRLADMERKLRGDGA